MSGGWAWSLDFLAARFSFRDIAGFFFSSLWLLRCLLMASISFVVDRQCINITSIRHFSVNQS